MMAIEDTCVKLLCQNPVDCMLTCSIQKDHYAKSMQRLPKGWFKSMYVHGAEQ